MSEQETNTDTDIPMSLDGGPTSMGNEQVRDMPQPVNGGGPEVDDPDPADLDLDPRQPVLTSARGRHYHLPSDEACDEPVCTSTCDKGWRRKDLIMVDAGYEGCDQCFEVAVKASGAVHIIQRDK